MDPLTIIGLAVAGFCLTWAAMDVVALVVRRLVK